MSIHWFGNYSHGSCLTRLIALALLLLSIGGCGMQLRPDPIGSESSLSGQWQLQAPQREALASNLRAVMEQVRAKQDKRDRLDAKNRPEPDVDLTPPDPDGDAASHASTNRHPRRIEWEVRERLEQQDALLNAVLPSDKLQIIQTPTQTELIPSSGARRRFDKGVTSTLGTQYATLRVESGWQANVFVVHSKDSEQSIDIVERYQRLGSHLHMQVQMKIPDAKDQLFSADYVLAQP